MRRFVALLIVFAAGIHARAEASDRVAQQEISRLIGYLTDSGCKFGRNGKWYDASRAASHLNRKYEYLLERDLVPTAEAFIERAASASSTTGKPYLVKCADGPELKSASWFRAALDRLRAAKSVGSENG
jgi:hypothetical protein